MKILIIYHAGASLNARAIFHELSLLNSISLTVIAPERLKVDPIYDSTGWLSCSRDESSNSYRLSPIGLRDPSRYCMGFERQPLRAILRAAQPDIIHVFDEPVSGYLFQVACERLTTAPKAKLLFFGFENIPFSFRIHSRLKWRLVWRQMAGGVGANNECLENLKTAGFPNRPLQRVFWGVPTNLFRPMKACDLKRSSQLEYTHIVGFVGRFCREKGLYALIDALRCLPSSVHAVLVGNGPMRAELESLASSSDMAGRIHIRDVVDPATLATLINCMDVLCLPSLTTATWKEQYGRVIAEAMACGVPVVGSDSGAIPEVIGGCGLVVPENNANRLAEALSATIFGAGKQKLQQDGLIRAREELSCQAMARHLVGFYKRLNVN